MPRGALTVSQLANQSGFDVEDVIIELVRLGIAYAVDPGASIRSEHQRAAFRAVGLRIAADERKKTFWELELGLDPTGLDELLRTLGFRAVERAKVLPKGAHAKLRAYAEARRGPRVTLPASPAALRVIEEDLPIVPRPIWREIGQKRASNFLSAVDVQMIHEELELDAELADDPIFPPGVKSLHLLESACSRAETGAPADSKYPTVEMAAAALVHSLVHNHCFYNGNKRTALVSMMVFLDRNNQWLSGSLKQTDLYLWILEVARHRVLPDGFEYSDRADHEVLAMAEWIRKNSRAIERAERPITWRELRTLLVKDYACTVDLRGSSGKVVIHRTVRVPSRNLLRGFRKDVQKTATISNPGDGREMGLGTIKSIRSQLCLTEEFGIDSAIFYGAASSPDRFIWKYQRLLRDLAKV